MENLLAALTYVLQPYHIGVVFFGTLIGILVGAMPGLSSIMGLSIMMPLTLSLASGPCPAGSGVDKTDIAVSAAQRKRLAV